MNNDEKQLLKQIKELHSQILKDSHDSLQRAIKLGGILDDFKETVGHGHFIDWVNTYLPFSERTSRNYMSLFRHKDSIKEQNITSLLQAYKLIVNCNNYNTTVKRQEMKERRAEFADRDTKYNNPHSFINKVVCGDCCKVMDKMLEKGMQGKFSMILTSPPYNAGFNYGKLFKDSKPYSEYLDYLMQPFPYYLELLRLGGRVCYILGSMVQNSQRESQGDYNHQLIVDLCYRVRETYPSLRHFNSIIWDKNKKGRNPLNTKFGSFASPLSPVCRSVHEFVIVWAKEQFELPNENGGQTDITEDEFKEWSWSVWRIEPYANHRHLHPCSFPHKIVNRLLKLYSYQGDAVLDPYSGAGITAIEAKKLKRNYTCIEINPNYASYAKNKL